MRVLVSGQMRSGTTFLVNLLNAQQGVGIYADFLHITRLKRLVKVRSLTDKLSLEQKEAVIDRFYYGSDGCAAITRATGAQLKFEVASISFDSLLEFYDHIFAQMERPGCRIVVGHKSTASESGIRELLELCPDLKCLYLVRDPRDVLVSNMRKMGQDSVLVLQHWRDGVREIQRISHLPHLGSRVYMSRYEDLVSRPEEILPKIANFLGLDDFVVPNELEWYGKSYVANSSFEDIKKLFDTRGIGRWKKEADWIPALAEIIVGKELERVGYESFRSPMDARLKAYSRFWGRFKLEISRLGVSIVSLIKK
jgi:hypothetical protein